MGSTTSGREVAGSNATMSLIEFCKKGNLEGVKAALQSGADVNTKDKFGMTGLMWAIQYPHGNSVVALLLNTPNIDVNLKSEMGFCALYFAVRNSEGLKLLLNVSNIDVNIVDSEGLNAVHRAVDQYTNKGLKLLLSHPSLTTLTLNQKEKLDGDTPLMLAMRRRDQVEHVEVLVADPRVDLDTTDKEGKSLEEVAIASGKYHCWAQPEKRKLLEEAKQRRLIREQQRQVSKVLLDGLYDPDSPISKLLGVHMEVVGEIIWQELVENWQIYPGQ